MLGAGPASAHDIWVQSNSNLIRTGTQVDLALMLGNHGNKHRDFRLASKVTAGQQSLSLWLPSKKSVDLTSKLIDRGYEPKEGFWSAQIVLDQPGLYLAASTFDQVMSYAPVRDIKSAKTFFLVSPTMDMVADKGVLYKRVLGHPLEIVPTVNPVIKLGAGSDFSVQVLYKGKPLANQEVSFIRKGSEPVGDFDARYQAKTNANGIAKINLKTAGEVLVVTHVKDETAKGKGYESIGYSATLHLLVPAICVCCSS
ncbi:MAG: DUF4198 domain-containing protein [Fimbriimonas sp.]